MEVYEAQLKYIQSYRCWKSSVALFSKGVDSCYVGISVGKLVQTEHVRE